jgi:hypothetical protein
MSVTSVLDQIRRQRDDIAALDLGVINSHLSEPLDWQGRRSDVRYHLLRMAQACDEARVGVQAELDASGWRPSAAQRILTIACETRGELRALLVDVPLQMLDAPPQAGEWTLRQTLAHVGQVDERYRMQTAYAVQRWATDRALPLRGTPAGLPPGEPAADGQRIVLSEVLRALDQVRNRQLDEFVELTDEDLLAPSVWTDWEIDVRFRLLRLSIHERQHVTQMAKTLDALGWRRNETQLLLGQSEIAFGRLVGQLVGAPDQFDPQLQPALYGILHEEAQFRSQLRRLLGE